MIVTTLLEQKGFILNGLQNGDLIRIGGVIRKAAGTPGAGQVVAFLKEVAPSAVTAINPAAGLALKFGIGAVQTGVKLYAEHKTQVLITEGFNIVNNKLDEGFAATQKSLNSVLSISSIGAAASVLNLGLTAVGFAVMNHKINNLQKSVNMINGKIDNIDNNLSEISRILVEIRYLQYLHGKDLEKIIEEIYGIEMALLLQHVSEIRMVSGNLENYKEIKNKDISGYINTLTTNRFWFEGMVDNKINSKSEEKILSMLNYYRGWCISSTAEIQALRISNELEKADLLAKEINKKAKEITNHFISKIAPESQFGGIKRFGYHKFQSENLLIPEQIKRLMFLQANKELTNQEIINYSMEGGEKVVLLNPSETWLQEQASLGSILDTLEEMNERIESYSFEANYCNENYLGYEEWENLN